jgi:hypothetical protein
MIHFPKLDEDKKSINKLMSRTQVIEYFGISKSTLWRWSNVENKLPFIQINRRKFFKMDDIEKLIEYNYSPNFT